MNLTDLIADALKRSKTTPKKAKRGKVKDLIKRTKEELRELLLERCVPESIHLRVIRQTCKCGAEFSSINTVPLVKCVGPTLTHYRPEENLAKYDTLPYFIEPIKVDIPYCTECLPYAIYIEPTVPEKLIHGGFINFQELLDTVKNVENTPNGDAETE